MTQAMIDFATEIHSEHLEEASFLYEQRLKLLDNPEFTWLDIEAIEDRFEPHIDGLVVGEDLAMEVCKQRAIEGDSGELYAAVRAFCRQTRLELVLEVLEALNPEDAEPIQAFSDALTHEMPPSWESEWIRLLSKTDPKLISIVAKTIGYRRLDAEMPLLQTLQGNDTGLSATLIWALGRLREPSARALLLNNYLQHEDESVRSAAVLALLRIGEAQAINHCLRAVHSENWPLLPLGLGGGRSTVSVLLRIAATGKAHADCLISLGLLGDISAVDALLAHLTDPEFAEPAAIALNLITGAELYEEVFIPEAIDEDELFEEELEALQSGDGLTPPGTPITRLSRNPDDWRKWWGENRSRFSPGVRYRNGVPDSPACLLENLESEKSPRRLRQLAYEEWVIRYGVDFPFETDMFVVQQKRALAQYTEWIKANGSRFREGQWYFAGQLLS